MWDARRFLLTNARQDFNVTGKTVFDTTVPNSGGNMKRLWRWLKNQIVQQMSRKMEYCECVCREVRCPTTKGKCAKRLES